VPEPDAEVKDAVRISLRMPEGERVIRKFAPDASLEELYAFVECYDTLHSGEEIPEDIEEPVDWTHEFNFRLVSPMPRQVYDIGSGGTIKEKVGRSGNLIVEQILPDEDDEDMET
jgi:FAS-associated factor 2